MKTVADRLPARPRTNCFLNFSQHLSCVVVVWQFVWPAAWHTRVVQSWSSDMTFSQRMQVVCDISPTRQPTPRYREPPARGEHARALDDREAFPRPAYAS